MRKRKEFGSTEMEDTLLLYGEDKMNNRGGGDISEECQQSIKKEI